MDSKRIEELLARYWECETSLEEEQQLHQFFKQSDIPDHLKEAAAMFRYFDQQKKKSITDVTFDEKVLSSANKPQGKTRSLLYNTMRIAAGIAVLVVATWFIHKEVSKTDPATATVDTYDDPKLAFEETKKALMMISKSFGKAEQQAKNINLFNEAQEEIKKKDKAAKL